MGVRVTASTNPAVPRVLAVAHLIVGLVALGFALVLVVASRAPGAELETVLIGPGIVLTVLALAFLAGAVRVLRCRGAEDGIRMSRNLSVVELLAGVALAWGVVSAVVGGENLGAWRSPVLVPSLVLVSLGAWGLWSSARGPVRPGSPSVG